VLPRWLHEGRRALPHVSAVAWRLILAVALLEFVYVAVASVVLKTSLLKDFAARGDDLAVDYRSAYSVLPGRIEVEGLRVRFHDRNVEFLIAVEDGTLDVSLHELFVRRFHALRVDGRQVSYRMRHKVMGVGKEGPRLAAYPPIPGFRDPPLYAKGEDLPAAPIPDEKYALWEVKVEGVRAEVAEVWILEYRYRGSGLATGAFHIQPAREYDVERATLDLYGGTLTLGDRAVAKKTTLAIECSVVESDPRRLSGLDPLRNVNASVRGRLEQMDLAFLDAYLLPRLGAAAGGRGVLDLDVRVERGVLSPGTGVKLAFADARLTVSDLVAKGAGAFELVRPRAGEPKTPFELRFRSERLDLGVGKGEGARVDHLELGIAVTPDLAESPRPVRAWLAPVRVQVPELAAFGRALPSARELPEVRGRAVLVARASKDGAGPIRGEFRTELSNATLAVGGDRTLPWNASLSSENVEAHLSGRPQFDATLLLHVDQSSAFLPLLSSSPFVRDLGKRLFRLEGLDARAKVRLGERSRLELLDARAGIARARGHLVEQEEGVRGRFLVSTDVGNVGIAITAAGIETDLLVGDDWLGSASGPRGAQARPERGGLPQRSLLPTSKASGSAARRLH
jgi:hypothetical protein